MDRARFSLGRRCQGNFKPTIVPATCQVRIYRVMCWKFLSTGRRREENPVNEAFTGADGRLAESCGYRFPTETMREYKAAT